MGILDDSNNFAVKVLKSLEVDTLALQQAIESKLDDSMAGSINLPLTPNARQVIELAPREASSSQSKETAPEQLLLAILKHQANRAARFLKQFDVDYDIYKAELFYLQAEQETAEASAPSPPSRPRLPAPDMVRVEGSTFQMGEEKNTHQVSLSSFEIGQYPVTVKEYLSFVTDTGRNQPEWMEEGSQYNVETGKDDHYKKIGDALTNEDCPIVGVSWFDAISFCNWLSEKHGLQPAYQQAEASGSSKTTEFSLNLQANGYRLPTEAEWEYAAWGGQQSKGYEYAGSNDLDEVGWYSNNSGGKTHPVGLKNPNELGLYDMSGNVWEWCWDWYGDYPKEPRENPTGPYSGSYRVLRGGSWYSRATYARCSNRDGNTPDFRYGYLGFRLARTGGL